MIDELANLDVGAMLSVDNDDSKEFTGLEDFQVDEVTIHQHDDGQIVMIRMEDYTLIATDISGEPCFAICETYDENDEYLDNDCFVEEIELAGGEDEAVYQIVHVIEATEDDSGFAQYKSDNYYNFMMLQKSEDSCTVFRGVEIASEDLVL